MPDLPCGTVTFLFTDIEGSTALWERDRAAMATAVERHLALLRRGHRRPTTASSSRSVGDAVQAAFPTAPDAVAAALDAQRALVQRGRGRRGRTAAGPDGAAYRRRDAAGRGLPRSRAEPARAPAGRGHGGQVLLSLATQDLARDALPPGAEPARPRRASRCATSTDRSGSSNCCIPICRPTSPRSGRWPPAPTTCPLQPTPFLGREEQVARVVDLLQPR